MNNKMKQKGFVSVGLIVAILIVLGIIGYGLSQKAHVPTPEPGPGPVACTQEAKLCPDGSYVGRVGPNCEFAACPPVPTPKPQPGESTVYLREGQREGSLQVLKIYPDRVEGLNFWEYPVARDEGYPITLRVGETASNGCTVTLTLIRIIPGFGNGDFYAEFDKKVDENRMCPICLAGGTFIATPNGEVKVENLKVGDLVWTQNEKGERIAVPIIKVGKTSVPPDHKMVRLVSPDGRILLVSPGHSLPDGRLVGDVYAERVSYSQAYTYDILPGSATGFYWANSLLLDSTLHWGDN